MQSVASVLLPRDKVFPLATQQLCLFAHTSSDSTTEMITERILAGRVKVDSSQIGSGKQALFIVGGVFGCALLLILITWLCLRPFQRRRRKLESKVPRTKTNYIARYQFRGESRSCTMSLVFRRANEAGWTITGTSMGQKCKFIRGRLSTFGSADITLGDGGMFISAVFDPDTGKLSGTWKKKRSSKETFPLVLEPQEQVGQDLPSHASIV